MYNGVNRLAGTEEACLELGGQWKEGVEPGSDGNVIEKCHVEHGVLADLNPQCADDELACDDPNIAEAHAPTNFGGCADCHAPGINGQLMGRNLHDAVGLAYDAGVHCDTCLIVRDIDMSKPAGYGSRLVVIVWRTVELFLNGIQWTDHRCPKCCYVRFTTRGN